MSPFAHFLMAQELLELSGRHARYEALSSKPGFGEKVTAALRSMRFRPRSAPSRRPASPPSSITHTGADLPAPLLAPIHADLRSSSGGGLRVSGTCR